MYTTKDRKTVLKSDGYLDKESKINKPCKGFWSMCSCEKCLKRDRKLDAALCSDWCGKHMP